MNKTKLEYAQMANGKFAICPDCGKVMVRRADGAWCCLLSCGKEILLKEQSE